jgi:general stress protein CsbA
MILFALFILLMLVVWLDRIARAQEVAALTMIRLYAALMNRP